jgi:hypothetical protein
LARIAATSRLDVKAKLRSCTEVSDALTCLIFLAGWSHWKNCNTAPFLSDPPMHFSGAVNFVHENSQQQFGTIRQLREDLSCVEILAPVRPHHDVFKPAQLWITLWIVVFSMVRMTAWA